MMMMMIIIIIIGRLSEEINLLPVTGIEQEFSEDQPVEYTLHRLFPPFAKVPKCYNAGIQPLTAERIDSDWASYRGNSLHPAKSVVTNRRQQKHFFKQAEAYSKSSLDAVELTEQAWLQNTRAQILREGAVVWPSTSCFPFGGHQYKVVLCRRGSTDATY